MQRCQTTSTVATVVITVNNSAVANNDAFGTSSNRVLSVGMPSVLANAQGGAGPLTAILDTGPADGSLILTNNGGFSYTPVKGYIGLIASRIIAKTTNPRPAWRWLLSTW